MNLSRPFEFRRVGGDVTYRFEPLPADGRPVGDPPRWKRTDLDLWCQFLPGAGWRIVDPSGSVLGWPLHDPPGPNLPPPGRWLSAKSGKHYEYDLVYV